MAVSSSPTLPQTRSNRWVFGVLAVVILGGVVATGLVLRGRHAAEVQREAAERAAQAAGEDLQAARAIAKYLAKVESQLREHDMAFQRLQREQVLAWNIPDRGHLEADRKIIDDFLATNARLKDTVRYGADLIRAEMATAKVPDGVRDSALAVYAKTQAPLLPWQMRVRDCDEALGKSALAVLDFLELNWGAWRRDDATGRIEFNNTVTLVAFKDYVEKTKAAGAAREAAQQDLVAFQQRRAVP